MWLAMVLPPPPHCCFRCSCLPWSQWPRSLGPRLGRRGPWRCWSARRDCCMRSHGFAMSLMSGGHLVMLFTHLAAAVGVGVWLAAGDRTFGAVLVLTARQVQDAWRTVTDAAQGAISIVSNPRFSAPLGPALCGCLCVGGGRRLAARPTSVLRRLNLTRVPPSSRSMADHAGTASKPFANGRRISSKFSASLYDRPRSLLLTL
jgi:hypothetical protein